MLIKKRHFPDFLTQENIFAMQIIWFVVSLFAMYLWYLTSQRVKHPQSNKLSIWVQKNSSTTKALVVFFVLIALLGFVYSLGLLAGIMTGIISTVISLSLVIAITPMQLFKRSNEC